MLLEVRVAECVDVVPATLLEWALRRHNKVEPLCKPGAGTREEERACAPCPTAPKLLCHISLSKLCNLRTSMAVCRCSRGCAGPETKPRWKRLHQLLLSRPSAHSGSGGDNEGVASVAPGDLRMIQRDASWYEAFLLSLTSPVVSHSSFPTDLVLKLTVWESVEKSSSSTSSSCSSNANTSKQHPPKSGDVLRCIGIAKVPLNAVLGRGMVATALHPRSNRTDFVSAPFAEEIVGHLGLGCVSLSVTMTYATTQLHSLPRLGAGASPVLRSGAAAVPFRGTRPAGLVDSARASEARAPEEATHLSPPPPHFNRRGKIDEAGARVAPSILIVGTAIALLELLLAAVDAVSWRRKWKTAALLLLIAIAASGGIIDIAALTLLVVGLTHFSSGCFRIWRAATKYSFLPSEGADGVSDRAGSLSSTKGLAARLPPLQWRQFSASVRASTWARCGLLREAEAEVNLILEAVMQGAIGWIRAALIISLVVLLAGGVHFVLFAWTVAAFVVLPIALQLDLNPSLALVRVAWEWRQQQFAVRSVIQIDRIDQGAGAAEEVGKNEWLHSSAARAVSSQRSGRGTEGLGSARPLVPLLPIHHARGSTSPFVPPPAGACAPLSVRRNDRDDAESSMSGMSGRQEQERAGVAHNPGDPGTPMQRIATESYDHISSGGGGTGGSQTDDGIHDEKQHHDDAAFENALQRPLRGDVCGRRASSGPAVADPSSGGRHHVEQTRCSSTGRNLRPRSMSVSGAVTPQGSSVLNERTIQAAAENIALQRAHSWDGDGEQQVRPSPSRCGGGKRGLPLPPSSAILRGLPVAAGGSSSAASPPVPIHRRSTSLNSDGAGASRAPFRRPTPHPPTLARSSRLPDAAGPLALIVVDVPNARSERELIVDLRQLYAAFDAAAGNDDVTTAAVDCLLKLRQEQVALSVAMMCDAAGRPLGRVLPAGAEAAGVVRSSYFGAALRAREGTSDRVDHAAPLFPPPAHIAPLASAVRSEWLTEGGECDGALARLLHSQQTPAGANGAAEREPTAWVYHATDECAHRKAFALLATMLLQARKVGVYVVPRGGHPALTAAELEAVTGGSLRSDSLTSVSGLGTAIPPFAGGGLCPPRTARARSAARLLLVAPLSAWYGIPWLPWSPCPPPLRPVLDEMWSSSVCAAEAAAEGDRGVLSMDGSHSDYGQGAALAGGGPSAGAEGSAAGPTAGGMRLLIPILRNFRSYWSSSGSSAGGGKGLGQGPQEMAALGGRKGSAEVMRRRHTHDASE